MDNTLLISLSHQLAQQRSMDVIANNLANMNTAAYKREESKFDEYVHQSRPSQWQKGPQSIDFVVNPNSIRDMSEGSIEQTGNTFDVAINGNGYFAVQTARGERYTRNGHFTLDSEGRITTSEGDQVLGDGGAISVAQEDGDVTIGTDGVVSGDQGQIGRLQIVRFNNERAMQKEGDTYLNTTEVATPADGGYSLKQGMLERSNIEPVTQMTDMINVMRSYQAVANLINGQETLHTNAITKLATIPS